MISFINNLLKLPRYILNKTNKAIKWWLFKIAKNWVILNQIHRSIRPAIWRLTGSKIGKNVSIGYDVYFDVSNASLITLEDDVWIASRTLLLCHRRDMALYYKNEKYIDLPYIKAPVTINKGACISMGAIILPGVTIGEGSVVGAGSIVTKDIPSWSVAAGNPAKVLRQISIKKGNDDQNHT